jgi:hypothetical protein
LADWAHAPAARACHPRKYLLPLMVAAGIAGTDRGRRDFSGRKKISGFAFG